MSAEVQAAPITTEAGVVEPTPAPAEAVTADKPAEAVAPVAEEPAKTEPEAVAPVEEKKAEEKPKEEAAVIEPIYSGALGYKAPGLKNAFSYKKKYFWFGEEPVPTSSLSQYLRGEKAEVAHSTAAWSSHTGKGLLYFVKHADDKATPAGVLKLSEASDLSKDGLQVFHFKLHGSKHSFETSTAAERNGWFVAIEKAIEEAKASKETVEGSESYKEELAKLGKPSTLAAPAANVGSTPKKSTDATPKVTEPEAEAATTDAAVPARTGSSSDEESKAKKSKSRSVSRGKRASIFGSFLGKKDKTEEKPEEKKKEETKEVVEPKKEEEAAAPAPVEPVAADAPVIAPIPIEEPIEAKEVTDVPEPVVAPAEVAPLVEEKKAEEKQEKPKPTKRGSIFGNFVEKLRSPTSEKKEQEAFPTPAAKEPEVSTEAPKIEEPAAETAAPVTEGTTEATPKTEETKPATTTPAKEKSGFSLGKLLGGAKDKVKSPTTDKSSTTETPAEAPKTEEPAKAEEPAAPAAAAEPVAPVEPAAEAPAEEKKEAEAPTGVTTTASATPTTKAKRGSIFGNLTGSVKKDKDGEEKPKGLSGLFRNASKAGKSKKEKEATATPAKVEETAEPTEEKAADPVVAEEKKEETPAAPATIGDVPADAVTVGQAPKSSPEVSATA